MNTNSMILGFSMLLFCATAFAADLPKTIPLWPEGPPGLKPDATAVEDIVSPGIFNNIHQPYMEVYPPPANITNAGTAAIFCAGGSYRRINTGVNGGETTQWLNSLGITVFVLHYRSLPYGYPAPQLDIMRAIRIVRSRAAELGVSPDRIGVVGNSAGGHVAASAGIFYDDAAFKTGAAIDKVSARPDFLVLFFPVITMAAPYAHADSRRNLIGDAPTLELADRMSLEKQVTHEMPPTFLVSSQSDTTVPEENTLMFYEAMRKAGVPGELHLYAKGTHGSGTSPNFGTTAMWPDLCTEWMRDNGWIPPSPDSLLKGPPTGPAHPALPPGSGATRNGNGSSSQTQTAAPSAAVPSK